ncbi:MAG: hypothetical protein RLZZ196_3548 [Bacteroidota bacterium]|jgi:hypothetical protein
MSGDINFNVADLNDSQSSAAKMSETFYPDGKPTYNNTTQSQEDLTGKTLTSADPLKVIQGEGIYRNPAFAMNGYMQNVQSSMHGIIAAAGDIDDDVKVPDPNDPNGTTYLTGSAARQEIAKQSILSTGYAPGGFSSAMDALVSSKSATDSGSAAAGTASGTGTVSGSQGEALAHSLTGYKPYPDAEVYNGGSRSIAFESDLSTQEKEVYDTKLKELNSKANFKATFYDFNLDFNTNSKQQDLKSLGFDIIQGGGYNKEGTASLGSVTIDKTLLGTGQRLCKVSAALIELMLQLTNKIFIRGGQGTDRGIIGNNFAALSNTDPGNTNSVSDHSFGRGFDIMGLGVTKEDITLGKTGFTAKKADYLKALDLLLHHLQTISYDLHPDLIMISDELSKELGLADSRIRG